jgi:hypothetical protein
MKTQDFKQSAQKILEKKYPIKDTTLVQRRQVNSLVALHQSIVNQEVEHERKTFGSCTKCYGKGYILAIDPDSQLEITHTLDFCICARAKRLKALIEDGQI